MFRTREEEQISFPSGDATDFLKPSLVELKSDHPDGSELPDSISPSSVYTDVNVVPEQEKNELERSISNLEGEIAQLRQKERLLDKKRKDALNKILDIKGSIRVFCRVRCFLMTEKRRIPEPISVCSDKVVVRSVACQKGFRFDKVFNQATTQEDVFAEVGPILRSALDGHNVCILAYGQTGTGKTFTMDGKNEHPGIIPRALEVLFHQASLSSSTSIKFSMSMLEVYMGNLRDLLAPKVSCKAYETIGKCNLNIQTDPKGLVEIEGLTNVEIPDISKAKWWYNKGRRARSTSWTNVNDASSRSHCLMKITIYRHGDDLKAKTEVSKLWMVDLGGSERLLKTGATGLTMDEGRAINLSLSALGDVIAALRRKRGHVPYRNSKLTQILKDSLGYSSKVLMLVHVSPCQEDVGETICSLSFANRARAIDTSSEAPEDLNKKKQKLITELEEDIKQAEDECQKVRHQIQKAEFLQSENKRLLLTTNQIPEDKEQAPQIPEEAKDTNVTSITTKERSKQKTSRSLPRFMTSTMASRQRQCAAEREITGRAARSFRSTARTSIQFSCSQSFSYSDIRLRAILRNSNINSRGAATKPLVTVSPKCNGNALTKPFLTESPKCNNSDAKTPFLPRHKVVVSSDPNLRIRLGHHTRRMSDLI